MLWEFKNNKNATKTTKKISSVCSQDFITDRLVWNWFLKFHFGDTSLRDEPRPGPSSNYDEDALRELEGCNPWKSTWELTVDFNNSQSIIWEFGFFILLMRWIRKITRQRNDLFLKNIIIGSKKCQCSTQKAMDGQGWISTAYPKGGASWKISCVYGRITPILFILSF